LRQGETCARYSSGDVPRRGRICSLDEEEPCERISVRRMQGNTAGVSRFSRQLLGAAAASRQTSCGIKTRALNYTQVTGCGFGGVIHPSQPSGRRDIPGPTL